MQAKPTVDDAEEHHHPAKPDVGVADETSRLVVDVVSVVQIAQYWLEQEGTYDNGAQDGVPLLKELWDQKKSANMLLCRGHSTARKTLGGRMLTILPTNAERTPSPKPAHMSIKPSIWKAA